MSLVTTERSVNEITAKLKEYATALETRELTESEEKEVDEKRGELRSLQTRLEREKFLSKVDDSQAKVVEIKDGEDRDWQTRCQSYSTANVMAKISTRAEVDTGSEEEITQELRARYPDHSPGDFVVPWESLQTRVLTTTGVGGALQTEDYKPGMLIEFLRPMLGNLGVTMLSGLSSDCRIPKKLSQVAATAWLAETGNAAEGTPSFSSISFSPHKVGAVASYSLQASIQSQPNVETLVRQDLQDALADFLNKEFLYGSGTSPAPMGIIPQITANDRASSTNGKALDLADLLALPLALAENNVMGGMWLCNPRTRSATMQTKKYGTDSDTDESLWMGGGLLGMPTVVTNFLSHAQVKGTGTGLSDIVYGNWSDAIIASWGGGLNLMANPYAGGSGGWAAGGVSIRILGFFDYAMRHGEAFVRYADVIA